MYEVPYGKVGVEYEVLYGKVGVEYALGTTKHQVQLACSRRQRSSALLLTRLIPHTSCLHAQKYKAGPLSAMFIGLLVEERRGPPVSLKLLQLCRGRSGPGYLPWRRSMSRVGLGERHLLP